MSIQRDPVFNGKKLMTIKEFASFAGIEQTTLRYWEEVGLITPAARNPENNYRYYSPLQMSTVNFISLLSGLGVPLKDISSVEEERTPEKIARLLAQQVNRLDMEMHRLRESYSIIHCLLSRINLGLQANEDEIAVVHIEDSPYILGPPNDWRGEPSFFETFMAFCKQAPRMRVNLDYPIGALHESMEEFLRRPSEPQYYFSIDPTGFDKRPEGDYLVGYARGYYGEFGDLPQRMAAYAETNNLILHGPVYVGCLHDEICLRELDQYLMRISVAARPGKKTAAPVWKEVS